MTLYNVTILFDNMIKGIHYEEKQYIIAVFNGNYQ